MARPAKTYRGARKNLARENKLVWREISRGGNKGPRSVMEQQKERRLLMEADDDRVEDARRAATKT
jgi:hypothetical protein